MPSHSTNISAKTLLSKTDSTAFYRVQSTNQCIDWKNNRQIPCKRSKCWGWDSLRFVCPAMFECSKESVDTQSQELCSSELPAMVQQAPVSINMKGSISIQQIEIKYSCRIWKRIYSKKFPPKLLIIHTFTWWNLQFDRCTHSERTSKIIVRHGPLSVFFHVQRSGVMKMGINKYFVKWSVKFTLNLRVFSELAAYGIPRNSSTELVTAAGKNILFISYIFMSWNIAHGSLLNECISRL